MIAEKTATLWVNRSAFTLQRFALFRAVRALSASAPGSLEALALIRAAFTTEDGGWATLDDARELLEMIRREK